MKQFIQMKFVIGLLGLLILSSIPSIAHDKASATERRDCPESAEDWDGYKIKINNVDDYVLCFEALKNDFEASKPREGMNMTSMHTSLLNGYKKLIDYYNDGNTGDDDVRAAQYEEELSVMKRKKPPKEKNDDDNETKELPKEENDDDEIKKPPKEGNDNDDEDDGNELLE